VKTWLFWDWWHIEHQDNVCLCQGEPEWIPEATYEDPTFDYLGSWPCVTREEAKWLMVYPASGFPQTLMAAESDDGICWRPKDCADIEPGGEKFASHHVYTLPSANGGPVCRDPLAADGYPYKCFCVQRGGPAAERARHDPSAPFHEIVVGEGVKPYLADNVVLRSRDGLHWERSEDTSWAFPGWHPDPLVPLFLNRRTRKLAITTRPGWGDRRIAMLKSDDGIRWSPPELILQPDPLDPAGTQFYGMPVHEYCGTYVGFLYVAHFASSERLERFNQLWGPVDSQLAYSADGEHWQRGLRQPFVQLNEPGMPGSGVIYPTALVEMPDHLRIYSASTPDLHHQYASNQFVRKGEGPASAIILHKLRKDGFTYLGSRGNWARFITKPLVLLAPELTMNVLAPQGEVQCQVTNLESAPVEGFTFEDFVPCREQDTTAWSLGWRGRSLAELMRKVLRLEVRFRHARLHAVRGHFHFADALDVALVDDGREIDTRLFDS